MPPVKKNRRQSADDAYLMSSPMALRGRHFGGMPCRNCLKFDAALVSSSLAVNLAQRLQSFVLPG